MSDIRVAHVVYVNWNLSRGIQAITERICSKIKTSFTCISEIKDIPLIKEEVEDLITLKFSNLMEKEIRYTCDDTVLNSMELMDKFADILFFNNEDTLGKEIKVVGMNNEEYIALVEKCNNICNKYELQESKII